MTVDTELSQQFFSFSIAQNLILKGRPYEQNTYHTCIYLQKEIFWIQNYNY